MAVVLTSPELPLTKEDVRPALRGQRAALHILRRKQGGTVEFL